MNQQQGDEERGPVRRPRVVDKRVSAGGQAAEERPEPAPATTSPPPSTQRPPTPPPEAGPQEAGPQEGLWTPEQEAEAMRVVEEIARVPARDWIADSAVRLANVAGVKLDRGDLAEAQLAIDALAALIAQVGARLGEAETPLRQTLAQLQLAFAQSAASPPPPGP
jgi:hypothetical protein